MERRNFVSVIGGISVGLTAAPGIITSVLASEMGGSFTDYELKIALEKNCQKIFNSSPDKEYLAPNGRYFFAESFEIEVDSKINSIFDFADQVIEKSKSSGFDASALKEGKIPNGMQVYNGGVVIKSEKIMKMFKVEGLKNYNATITYKNGINIATKVPPCEWIGLKKIEKMDRGNGYEGNLKGPFRIWIMGNRPINLNVEEIEPAIRFSENNMPLNTVSSSFLKEVFSDKIQEIIFPAQS